MTGRNKKLIRILAIVLVVLLAGGVVFSALFSSLAEEQTEVASARGQCTLAMEYMPDEQALHVTQRLIYVNPSDGPMRAVVFNCAGNMFRRESALMYEPDELETVFFAGYAPAGVDLTDVRVDGKPTEFGFQGEGETFLRVDCDLAPGGRCEFEFDYYLLLMRCGAFQGVGDTDVRLSAFYFSPGVYDPNEGDFILKKPLSHTRWLYADPMDFDATLALPEGYVLAGTGEIERDGNRWHVAAKDVRELALSFGRRWRATERQTASGVTVRVLSGTRGMAAHAAQIAADAIERCEDWFGPFPFDRLDIAQSDYPLGALNFPGAVWLSGDLLRAGSADALAHRLRFCVAQQYFGIAASPEPVVDAWLSDAVSEYISYLLLEDAEGRDAFLKAVNRDWVPALQQTVPGGLRLTTDAAMFNGREYGIVVLNRGAVVLHELRQAMGLEGLLDGLRGFYQMGRDSHILTEMDLVAALDAATGQSWEAFLTDWAFNVGDYTNQTIDWFE